VTKTPRMYPRAASVLWLKVDASRGQNDPRKAFNDAEHGAV